MTLNGKQFWHLTDDPHFTPDPNHVPENNSLYLGRAMRDKDPAGLYVTDRPEHWMQAHGYERPYVAQVEGHVNDEAGLTRDNEHFLQGPMQTKRVLTIDEYAREKFHEPGWVEEHHAPPIKFGDPIPRMPRDYQARTTSDMKPEELADYEGKFKDWTQRSR